MLDLFGEHIELQQVIEAFGPAKHYALTVRVIDSHRPVDAVDILHTATQRIYRVTSTPMKTEQHSLVQFNEVTYQVQAEQRRQLAEHIFDQSKNAVLVFDRDFSRRSTKCG